MPPRWVWMRACVVATAIYTIDRGSCAQGLAQVRTLLAALNAAPQGVVFLDDPDSEVLGRALGALCDLPVRPLVDADREFKTPLSVSHPKHR